MRENPHSVPLFTEVAPRYEFLNSLMTAGRDRYWRRETLRSASALLGRNPETILDLATGTGDVARLLKKLWPKAQVIGSDPTPAMLLEAKKSSAEISWQEGVAEKINLSDNSVDLVTIAFGFRNVDATPREQALKEIWRVLKPGGVFAILELGLPPAQPLRALYTFLLSNIMPHFAGLFSPKAPYLYLAKSIRQFPTPQAVAQLMQKTGYLVSPPRSLTLGMSWLYLGKKP